MVRTAQPVNGPLLKLLEGDVCGWRGQVEVQAVRVVGVLVGRLGELLLAVVDDISPLGVDAPEVLPDHGVCAGCPVVRVKDVGLGAGQNWIGPGKKRQLGDASRRASSRHDQLKMGQSKRVNERNLP